MKTPLQIPTVLTRSMLALSFGCALAALPVVVRAQTAPDAVAPTSDAAAPATAMPDASPAGDAAAAAPVVPKKMPMAAAEKFTESDKVILHKYANGNEGEVQAAKVALANSESQDVKDFAQKMIDEHGAANKELMDIATAHGMDLKPELTASEKASQVKMKQTKGAIFDGQYAKHAVADHTEDVKEYQKDNAKIKDAQLKAYGEKTLPIVEEHLKMAKELQGKTTVGGEAKAKKAAKQS